MLDEIFNINNYNIIEDKDYYYFFRALNNGDLEDYNKGIITNKNGEIELIRTDLERYKEKSKYNQNSTLTLEEVIDHIKPNHRYDTNCISISTNANVTALYGREYYQDKYVIIKITKQKLNKEVIDAGLYILKEIKSYLNNDIKIKKINNYISKDAIYFNSLNKLQLEELKKIINNINGKEKDIISNFTNKLLIETINNAFLSLEFIHYKKITKEKIIEINSQIIDAFSIIQQLPIKDKERQLLAECLINNINNVNLFCKNEIIDNKDNINNKLFYLAKSKLRVIKAISLLNNLTNNQYKDYLLKKEKTLYGVEPNIFSKSNTSKYKANDCVYLNINEEELPLLNKINNLNEEELEIIIKKHRLKK